MPSILKKINNSTTHDYFPQEFSNEIYYSKTDYFEPFTYKTNLTLKYVHKGTDNYKIEHKEHNLKKNQYLIINSGSQVTCFSSDNIHEGISIFMDESILSEVYNSFMNPNELIGETKSNEFEFLELPHYADNNLGDFLENTIANVTNSQSLNELENDDYLYYQIAELMLESQIDLSNRIQRISRLKKNAQIEIYKKVMSAKNHIDNNFHKSVDLESLSKIVGLSKYYLIKCFKSVYGFTPHNYILEKRILKGKKELLLDQKSIIEISHQLGFADLSSFSKRFKKSTGLSPKSFRIRNSSKNNVQEYSNFAI